MAHVEHRPLMCGYTSATVIAIAIGLAAAPEVLRALRSGPPGLEGFGGSQSPGSAKARYENAARTTAFAPGKRNPALHETGARG